MKNIKNIRYIQIIATSENVRAMPATMCIMSATMRNVCDVLESTLPVIWHIL